MLSRVRDFLPKLAESNKKLAEEAKNDTKSVSIESVDEDKPYIEMVTYSSHQRTHALEVHLDIEKRN